MKSPTLFIFSGLPGTGKSSLAKELSKNIGATYLRIDTVEQGLRDLCNLSVEGEGYRLSYRIASDNLKIGQSVIADSCNPIDLTRKEWNSVATEANANSINIEIICTDTNEHKNRVETRKTDIIGLELPSWNKVVNREYQPWGSERITIDTSQKTIEQCVTELINAIKNV